ncbi:dr1-associated corepressor [Thalassophryne amazonica]|uniref:dr1-associated corepressor n=1 Tax=Thalassophryne amazonica TaxID=390379 RepID=UPI001471B3E4|nr:dr1-associated corepressor [Thalassophryne amazonica]
MPRQKTRYNVRFSPNRIKKIMQQDREVGKIAKVVPVIISRALEMFLKSLLTKSCLITESKLSTVISLAHMKQCIETEQHFHFLKDLVEQVTSAAAQKDIRSMSVLPLRRTKQDEAPVKKQDDAEETVQRPNLDSLDNNSSSSEMELYICL